MRMLSVVMAFIAVLLHRVMAYVAAPRLQPVTLAFAQSQAQNQVQRQGEGSSQTSSEAVSSLSPTPSSMGQVNHRPLTYSILIPAHNEAHGIARTLEGLSSALSAAAIPFEILVINDHSTDATEAILKQASARFPEVRYLNSPLSQGFGRAIQFGLSRFRGDAVCIVMPDASDDPHDVVTYYRKLSEGYECVFGSRFLPGSLVIDYPKIKWLINRLANGFIQFLFRIPLNDTTNAFKAYRRKVIEGVSPIVSQQFNITVELPLKAIIRGFTYTVVPVHWRNQAQGAASLELKERGSRYLFVILVTWLEQKLTYVDYRRKDEPSAPTGLAAPTPTHDAGSSGAPATRSPLAPLWSAFKRAAGIAVWVVPVILLTAILWSIWNRTPQVPFWDEWQNIDMVVHFKQGTLQFADFWAFHNEHRIVIPRMLDLGLIELTHWNEQVMMTFDLGIAVAEAALLLAAVRRGLDSSGWMVALVAPIALLVFSFGQYENWLWAFQITFICTVFGVALCVYGFARQPATWWPFSLALAGAFIAAWSSVGGTMAWIAFAPAAWRAGRGKGLLWSVVGAVVLITYFQGFPHSVPLHVSLGMLGFSLGYLGAPLGALNITKSLVFAGASVVLVLANLVIYWRAQGSVLGSAQGLAPSSAPSSAQGSARNATITLDAWFGLALFALAVDGVTTMGRYQLFGFSDFLTSRYQVFSVLWWVAVVVLAAINGKQAFQALRAAPALAHWNSAHRRHAAVWAGNLIAITLCCGALIASSLSTWSLLENYMYPQRLDEVCVANYQSAPNNCLHGFVWDPAYLRHEAAILDQYHLSIFANNVGTTRPLIEYVNHATGDEWTTTTLVDPRSGYTEAQWLGLVYVNQHLGTRPLYQCLTTSSAHMHFVSLDATCGKQTLLGLEGWIYLAPSTTEVTTPLYRCTAGKVSFVSTEATCNGKTMNEQLGYIVTEQIPWQG